MPQALKGWRTSTRRRDDGAVESEQVAVAERPIVDESREGAEELARCYWSALERVALLARVVGIPERVRVRVLGRGPALLRFAPPHVELRDGYVGVRYGIEGGLLARCAGGEIVFSQAATAAGWEVRSTVTGFRPRLPAIVYLQIQRRVHVAVGRRYLRTLLARAA